MGTTMHILSGQKYFNTIKFAHSNNGTYCRNYQQGPRKKNDIGKYRKYVVLALTLALIFEFLVFHEVLTY